MRFDRYSLADTVRRRAVAGLIFLLLVVVLPLRAAAQQHEPAAPPAAHGAQPEPAAHGETAQGGDEAHEEGILPTIARLANFAILVGLLAYFLKSPFASYLSSRSAQIRQDLVTAADLRATATAQLAEIDRKLKALPAELDVLRAQGADDVKAERVRIAHAAAAERERLLDQTRREIDMRLRIARRALIEHAAQLAVGVARTRIERMITPDDQLRLVDRYSAQLKEAR